MLLASFRAYGNAEQDDLWRFLTQEATASRLLDRDISVKQIMDTWTLQIGFPVLKVTPHPNTNVIQLQQQRFQYVNTTLSQTSNHTSKHQTPNATEQMEDPLWWIPITYTTAEELNFENTRPLTWIPCTRSYEIEDRNLSTAKWYIFNIQQTGYYRVNYHKENWQAIIEHLMMPQMYQQIATSNRAQLLDDVLNLARGGYVSYDIALNMTRYLKHESEHVPWKAAIMAYDFIDRMFVSQGDYDLLKVSLSVIKIICISFDMILFRTTC